MVGTGSIRAAVTGRPVVRELQQLEGRLRKLVELAVEGGRLEVETGYPGGCPDNEGEDRHSS
jgi:hypothetical protein